MAAGDVGLTFTIDAAGSTVLVGGARTGNIAADRNGRPLDSHGATTDDGQGIVAQEDNGTLSRGTTGAIT